MMMNQKIELHSLTHNEKILLAKELYAKPSHFTEQFRTDWIEFACQNIAISFRNNILEFLFKKKIINENIELENLHLQLTDEKKAYDFKHGVNSISTEFYNTDPQLLNTYYDFIRFIRNHIIKEPFWFQATPTIRVHCPNAINSDLYPRYHTDICYGHPPEEINFWLPLTATLDGHGFSILSIENSKKVLSQFHYDYDAFIQATTYDRPFSNYCDSLSHAVDTPFGHVFIFDPRCVHSGHPLKTHTRISIDIRVLPVSLYKKMNIEYRGSGRLQMLFSPGNGYNEKNSDELII